MPPTGAGRSDWDLRSGEEGGSELVGLVRKCATAPTPSATSPGTIRQRTWRFCQRADAICWVFWATGTMSNFGSVLSCFWSCCRWWLPGWTRGVMSGRMESLAPCCPCEKGSQEPRVSLLRRIGRHFRWRYFTVQPCAAPGSIGNAFRTSRSPAHQLRGQARIRAVYSWRVLYSSVQPALYKSALRP